MDVSNGTGEDTQSRTGSGTTKRGQWEKWTALPAKGIVHCPDPAGSWTIFFRLHAGTTISESITEPMAAVTLEKSGNDYRITSAKGAVKKPAQPAKPTKPAKVRSAA